MQIALSSNHILLAYKAYLTSVEFYSFVKQILLHVRKGTSAPSAYPNVRQEGRLFPLFGVPAPNMYQTTRKLVMLQEI